MTLEEALTEAEAELDAQIARQLERDEIFLADRGGTDDEVAEFIAHRKVELERWKTDTLAEIRRGLSDWKAPTGKLQ